MKKNQNFIRIKINAMGGEFVLGTITKEEYKYWSVNNLEEFRDYALDPFYSKENTVPEEMDFLSAGWHECDNMEHIYGFLLDSSNVEIEFSNGIKHKISIDIENIHEVSEIYSQSGENYDLPKGFYFSAHKSEKGCLFDAKIKFPEGHDFDEKRLIYFSVDLNGTSYIVDIGYVMPEDSIDKPTMFVNDGGDTNGGNINFDIFEITRPE